MLADSPITAIVATTDRERARSFYRDTLGPRLIDDDLFALVFAAGGSELRVAIVDHVVSTPYTVFGWRVEDIRRAVLALRERGITFERFASMKPGRVRHLDQPRPREGRLVQGSRRQSFVAVGSTRPIAQIRSRSMISAVRTAARRMAERP